MRRAAKVDDNHNEIVDALRQIGASVKPVHALKGFVDIVVGYRGINYLIEIKDGKKPPSKQKLTEDEQKFHDEWKGQAIVVKNVTEALAVLQFGAKN